MFLALTVKLPYKERLDFIHIYNPEKFELLYKKVRCFDGSKFLVERSDTVAERLKFVSTMYQFAFVIIKCFFLMRLVNQDHSLKWILLGLFMTYWSEGNCLMFFVMYFVQHLALYLKATDILVYNKNNFWLPYGNYTVKYKGREA